MRVRERAAIRDAMRRDWPRSSPGQALLAALLDLNPEATQRLTLTFMRRIAKLESIEVARVVAEYFASTKLRLLAPRYAIIVDDHNEHEISRDDFYGAVVSGVLTDPLTGELVPDWRDRVIIYYSARSRLRRAITEAP